MEGELPADSASMSDILDIEGIIASPLTEWMNAGKFFLLLLAVGLLAWTAWRLWRRWRKGCKELSPAERAERDLEDLRRRGFSARGEWHAYYFALTAIAKRFITGQFKAELADRTTEEILRMERDLEGFLDRRLRESLKILLLRGDSAKFAKVPVTPDEAAGDERFVAELILLPPPPPIPEAKK